MASVVLQGVENHTFEKAKVIVETTAVSKGCCVSLSKEWPGEGVMGSMYEKTGLGQVKRKVLDEPSPSWEATTEHSHWVNLSVKQLAHLSALRSLTCHSSVSPDPPRESWGEGSWDHKK